MEGMNELTKMIALCESATTAREDLRENKRKDGRNNHINNKKKQIEALMQTTGLSTARIREHLDQLEK